MLGQKGATGATSLIINHLRCNIWRNICATGAQHFATSTKMAARRYQNPPAGRPRYVASAVPAASSRGFPAPCSLWRLLHLVSVSKCARVDLGAKWALAGGFASATILRTAQNKGKKKMNTETSKAGNTIWAFDVGKLRVTLAEKGETEPMPLSEAKVACKIRRK